MFRGEQWMRDIEWRWVMRRHKSGSDYLSFDGSALGVDCDLYDWSGCG